MSGLYSYFSRQVVAGLVAKFGDKYFDGIDANNLQASVLNGEVELFNISLKRSFLESLHLPLGVLNVTIRCVKVKVPIGQILSGSWVVSIDGLRVVLKPRESCEPYPATADEAQRKRDKKINTLTQAFKFKKKLLSALQGQLSATDKIVRNLQFELTELNIVLHHHEGETAPSVRVSLETLRLFSAGDDWEDTLEAATDMIFKKRATLTGLRVTPFHPTAQELATHEFMFFADADDVEHDHKHPRLLDALMLDDLDLRAKIQVAELDTQAALNVDVQIYVGNLNFQLERRHLEPPACIQGRWAHCGRCTACCNDVCIVTAVQRSLRKLQQTSVRPLKRTAMHWARDMWQYAVRCVILRKQRTRFIPGYKAYKILEVKESLAEEYKALKKQQQSGMRSMMSDYETRLLREYEYHLPNVLLNEVWSEILGDDNAASWWPWARRKQAGFAGFESLTFAVHRVDKGTEQPHVRVVVLNSASEMDVLVKFEVNEVRWEGYHCRDVGQAVTANHVKFYDDEAYKPVSIVRLGEDVPRLRCSIGGHTLPPATFAAVAKNGKLVVSSCGRQIALPWRARPELLISLRRLCSDAGIPHNLPERVLIQRLDVRTVRLDYFDPSRQKKNSALFCIPGRPVYLKYATESTDVVGAAGEVEQGASPTTPDANRRSETTRDVTLTIESPVSLKVDPSFVDFLSALNTPSLPSLDKALHQDAQEDGTSHASRWRSYPIAGACMDFPFVSNTDPRGEVIGSLSAPPLLVSCAPRQLTKAEGRFVYAGQRHGHPMWRSVCAAECGGCAVCTKSCVFTTASGRWMVGPPDGVTQNRGWVMSRKTHGGLLPHRMGEGAWIEATRTKSWQRSEIVVSRDLRDGDTSSGASDETALLDTAHCFSPPGSPHGSGRAASPIGSQAQQNSPFFTPDDDPLPAHTSVRAGDMRSNVQALSSSLMLQQNSLVAHHTAPLLDKRSNPETPEGAPLVVEMPTAPAERVEFYSRPPTVQDGAFLRGDAVASAVVMSMQAGRVQVLVDGRELGTPEVFRLQLGGAPRLDLLGFYPSKVKDDALVLESLPGGRIPLPVTNLPVLLGQLKSLAERASIPHSIPSSIQAVGEHILTRPSSVDCSSGGVLYIADTANHRVIRWVPGCCTGTVVAGGNGAGNGRHQLWSPSGVCVVSGARDTSLFIADTQNHRIVRWTVDSDEEPAVVAGQGVLGQDAQHLNHPTDVKVGRDGKLYVCDSRNHRVQRWVLGAHAAEATVAGSSQCLRSRSPRLLDTPQGIFVDLLLTVYVADTNNHRVSAWPPDNPGGDCRIVAGGVKGCLAGQLKRPQSVIVTPDKSLVIADTGNRRVQYWETGSHTGRTIRAKMGSPGGLCTGVNDKVYVADRENNTVYQCTPPSTAINIQDGDGGSWRELSPTWGGEFEFEGVKKKCIEEFHAAVASRKGGWFSKQINKEKMYELLMAAFLQRPVPRRVLEASGEHIIRYVNPADGVWGTGADGNGHNWYGVLLGRVRGALRSLPLSVGLQLTRGLELSLPLSRASTRKKTWVAVLRAERVEIPGGDVQVKDKRPPPAEDIAGVSGRGRPKGRQLVLGVTKASFRIAPFGSSGEVLTPQDILQQMHEEGNINAFSTQSAAEAIGETAMAFDAALLGPCDLFLHAGITSDYTDPSQFWSSLCVSILPSASDAVCINLNPKSTILVAQFLREVTELTQNPLRAPSYAAYRSTIGAWQVSAPTLVLDGCGKARTRAARYYYQPHTLVVEKDRFSMNDRWVLKLYREEGDTAVWPCGTNDLEYRRLHGEVGLDPVAVVVLNDGLELRRGNFDMPDTDGMPSLKNCLVGLQMLAEPMGEASRPMEGTPQDIWDRWCVASISLTDEALVEHLGVDGVAALRQLLQAPQPPPTPQECKSLLIGVNTVLSPLYKSSHAIMWSMRGGIRGSKKLAIGDRVRVRNRATEAWQYGILSDIIETDGGGEEMHTAVIEEDTEDGTPDGVYLRSPQVFAETQRNEEKITCVMRHHDRAEVRRLMAILQEKLNDNNERRQEFGCMSGQNPHTTPAKQYWPEKHGRLDAEGFPEGGFYKNQFYVSFPRCEVKLCDMTHSTQWVVQMEDLWWESAQTFYDLVYDTGFKTCTVWEKRTPVSWEDEPARREMLDASKLEDDMQDLSLSARVDRDVDNAFAGVLPTRSRPRARRASDTPSRQSNTDFLPHKWNLRQHWQSLGDDCAQAAAQKLNLFAPPVCRDLTSFHRLCHITSRRRCSARRGSDILAPKAGWAPGYDQHFQPSQARGIQPWLHPADVLEKPLGAYLCGVISHSDRSLWCTVPGMAFNGFCVSVGDVTVDIDRGMLPSTVRQTVVWIDPVHGLPEALNCFRFPMYEAVISDAAPLSVNIKRVFSVDSLHANMGKHELAHGFRPGFSLSVAQPGMYAKHIYNTATNKVEREMRLGHTWFRVNYDDEKAHKAEAMMATSRSRVEEWQNGRTPGEDKSNGSLDVMMKLTSPRMWGLELRYVQREVSELGVSNQEIRLKGHIGNVGVSINRQAADVLVRFLPLDRMREMWSGYELQRYGIGIVDCSLLDEPDRHRYTRRGMTRFPCSAYDTFHNWKKLHFASLIAPSHTARVQFDVDIDKASIAFPYSYPPEQRSATQPHNIAALVVQTSAVCVRIDEDVLTLTGTDGAPISSAVYFSGDLWWLAAGTTVTSNLMFSVRARLGFDTGLLDIAVVGGEKARVMVCPEYLTRWGWIVRALTATDDDVDLGFDFETVVSDDDEIARAVKELQEQRVEPRNAFLRTPPPVRKRELLRPPGLSMLSEGSPVRSDVPEVRVRSLSIATPSPTASPPQPNDFSVKAPPAPPLARPSLRASPATPSPTPVAPPTEAARRRSSAAPSVSRPTSNFLGEPRRLSLLATLNTLDSFTAFGPTIPASDDSISVHEPAVLSKLGVTLEWSRGFAVEFLARDAASPAAGQHAQPREQATGRQEATFFGDAPETVLAHRLHRHRRPRRGSVGSQFSETTGDMSQSDGVSESHDHDRCVLLNVETRALRVSGRLGQHQAALDVGQPRVLVTSDLMDAHAVVYNWSADAEDDDDCAGIEDVAVSIDGSECSSASEAPLDPSSAGLLKFSFAPGRTCGYFTRLTFRPLTVHVSVAFLAEFCRAYPILEKYEDKSQDERPCLAPERVGDVIARSGDTGLLKRRKGEKRRSVWARRGTVHSRTTSVTNSPAPLSLVGGGAFSSATPTPHISPLTNPLSDLRPQSQSPAPASQNGNSPHEARSGVPRRGRRLTISNRGDGESGAESPAPGQTSPDLQKARTKRRSVVRVDPSNSSRPGSPNPSDRPDSPNPTRRRSMSPAKSARFKDGTDTKDGPQYYDWDIEDTEISLNGGPNANRWVIAPHIDWSPSTAMAYVAVRPERGALNLRLTVDVKRRKWHTALLGGDVPQEAWVHPIVIQTLTTVTFHNTHFKIPQFMSFFSKTKRGARTFAEVLASEFLRVPAQSEVRFADTCTIADDRGKIRPIPLSWVPSKRMSPRPPLQLRFLDRGNNAEMALHHWIAHGLEFHAHCVEADVSISRGSGVSRVFTLVSSLSTDLRVPRDAGSGGGSGGEGRFDVKLEKTRVLGGWHGDSAAQTRELLDVERFVLSAERSYDPCRKSFLGKITFHGAEGDKRRWLGLRLSSGDVYEIGQISDDVGHVLGEGPEDAPMEAENLAIERNIGGKSNIWRPSSIEISGQIGKLQVTLVEDKCGYDSDGARFGLDSFTLEGLVRFSGAETEVTDAVGVDLVATNSMFFETYNAKGSSWDTVADVGFKTTYMRQQDFDANGTPYLKHNICVLPWQSDAHLADELRDGLNVTVSADAVQALFLLMKGFQPNAVHDPDRVRNMSVYGPRYILKNETGIPVTLTTQVNEFSIGGAYQSKVHVREQDLASSTARNGLPSLSVIVKGHVPGEGSRAFSSNNRIAHNRTNRKIMDARSFGSAKLLFDCGARHYLPYCVAETSLTEGQISTTLRSTVLIRNECSFPIAVRLHHHIDGRKLTNVLQNAVAGSEKVAEEDIIIVPAASGLKNNICSVPLAYVQPRTGLRLCPLSSVLDTDDGPALKLKIEREKQQGNLRGVSTAVHPNLRHFDWSIAGRADSKTCAVPIYSLDKAGVWGGDKGVMNDRCRILCPVKKDPVPTNEALTRLGQNGLAGGCHLSIVYTPSWKSHELPSSGVEEDLQMRDIELVIQPTVKLTNLLPYAVRCHVFGTSARGEVPANDVVSPDLSSIVFELKKHVAKAKEKKQEVWHQGLYDAINNGLHSDAHHWIHPVLCEYGWEGGTSTLTAAPSIENAQGLLHDFTCAADPWVVRPGESKAFLGVSHKGVNHLAFTTVTREPVRSTTLQIPKAFSRGYYRSWDYSFRLDGSGERVIMTHVYTDTTQSAQTELQLWAPVWFVNKLDITTCKGMVMQVDAGPSGAWLWSQRHALNKHPLLRGEPFAYSFTNNKRTEHMRVKLDEGKYSSSITVGEVGVHNLVCARTRNSVRQFIPVSVSTATPPQDFASARIVTFTDQFVASNQTDFRLELRLAEFGDASLVTQVPPLSACPILWGFREDATDITCSTLSFSQSEIPLLQVKLVNSRTWSPPFSAMMLSGRAKMYAERQLQTTLSIHSSVISAVTYTTFTVSSTPNFQVNNMTSWPAKVFQVPPKADEPTEIVDCPQMTAVDCWLNELETTAPVRIKLNYDNSKKMVVEIDTSKLGVKEDSLREIHLLASCPYFVSLRMGGRAVCADILPKHHKMCFSVRLVSAKGLMARDTRICMPNTSDPFAKMMVDGRLPVTGGSCTKVIHNTCNPHWKTPDWKTFAIYHVDSTLTITLFDEDVIKDDFLGQLELPLRELHPTGKGRRTFELHSRPGGEDWDVLRSQNHPNFGTITLDFIFTSANETPDFEEELPVTGSLPANWPFTMSLAMCINVSVCGEVYGRLREIAFMELRDISMVIARENDGYYSGLLDVAGVQIDNSMDVAVSQVILAAADSRDPRPAFRCCFSRMKNKSFLVQAGYFGCFVQPMKLVLADSDVLSLYQGFHSCLRSVRDRDVRHRDLTRMFNDLDAPTGTEIARRAAQVYFRVREVLLHKVKPEITWLGMMRESRVLPQLQTWGLSYISVDAAKITLPEYREANIIFRREELHTLMKQHYLPAVVKSAVLLLGHTAFGNPIAVVRAIWSGLSEFFDEIADGWAQSSVTAVGRGAMVGLFLFIRHVVTGLIAVVATLCDFISTICGFVDSLGGGESYQRRYRINKRLHTPLSLWQGVVYGGAQFGNGLRYGLVGLVMKPYKGMCRKGCIGGMRGVVVGIVGLATKPPQGTFDLIATIAKGAIASINGPHRSKRVRPPRVIIDGAVSPYDRSCSDAYALLCLINLAGAGKLQGAALGDEYYVHHVRGVDPDTLYIMSTYRILHLREHRLRGGSRLLWDIDLNKVARVETPSSDVIKFVKWGSAARTSSKVIHLLDGGVAQTFLQIMSYTFPRIDCAAVLSQTGVDGSPRQPHTAVRVAHRPANKNLDDMQKVMESNNAVVLAQELKKMMELLREKTNSSWMHSVQSTTWTRGEGG